MNHYRVGRNRQWARNPLILTLALAAIALVVGFGVRLATKEDVAEAGDREARQAIQPAATSLVTANAKTPTAPTPTEIAGNEALAQTVNGITISIANARLESSQFAVDVCYDKPDHSNWLLRGATLEFGSALVDSFTATPISFRDPPVDGQQHVTTFVDNNPVESSVPAGDSNKGQRCDRLAFDLGTAQEANPNDTSYALTIHAIRMFPDEGTECTVYLTTIQNSLDARNTGIKLACAMSEQGAVVTIASKPEAMSQAAAEALAFNGDSFKVFGPWAFNGTIN